MTGLIILDIIYKTPSIKCYFYLFYRFMIFIFMALNKKDVLREFKAEKLELHLIKIIMDVKLMIFKINGSSTALRILCDVIN